MNSEQQQNGADWCLIQEKLHAVQLELLVVLPNPHRMHGTGADAGEGKDCSPGRRTRGARAVHRQRVIVGDDSHAGAQQDERGDGRPGDLGRVEHVVEQSHDGGQE